uniref:EF-hand domain-containing protein n=1 Tax=Polytomella parva TaxID=51329 RepID=A0A7S0V028_9CHLO|mmetsp:Transcript_2257/g.3420  ORF Transcript_2257/g.3420 Transcript_2257/m.3420 type:complete len:374 (+) Transcript_2257:95-1216(+)|eukprot:CAMPEP_0175058276 /NCGR_PEP_ID=MMETSP0052_2-20121109/11757_1 /TAXON_ID=51329 ORGANISM="Polytomella parva, Strain SAG 63-3" /NCGR_SAMPLE_ID=MMETSP0052_2 /ASSEMBLY_ACC=CAM_ASM_000194 /LENGTH=373 /DNA_ID=CAMNT_0016323637 /DNA_START=20 /DNA_END=1141 /DNA_ORIENTATION=+
MSELGEDVNNARSILYEKRARRNAEDDALRLYNRVRQLQKEEEKAQKRISETKKKAREIVRLRERNEQKLFEKEVRHREWQGEVERQKLDNLKLKEEQLRNKIELENKIYAEKVQLVQQSKDERMEIERLLAESKLLSRKDALEQKENVKKQQEDARRKIELLKLQKLQQAQEEYEKRLRDEIEAKMIKENEIMRLAQMELELIERLKSKQNDQRKAYQQLEAVLALSSVSVSRSSSKPTTPAGNVSSSTKGLSYDARASATSSVVDHLQQMQLQQQMNPQQQPSLEIGGNEGGGAGGDGALPEEPTDEDIARAFSLYDVDGVGEINTMTLGNLMADLGVPLNASQLSQAIAQLDSDRRGRVSFGEFLLWWKG